MALSPYEKTPVHYASASFYTNSTSPARYFTRRAESIHFEQRVLVQSAARIPIDSATPWGLEAASQFTRTRTPWSKRPFVAAWKVGSARRDFPISRRRITLKPSLGSYAHACCGFHYPARQPSTPADTTDFISHSSGLPPWDILLRSPTTFSNRRLAVTGKVCQVLEGGLVPICCSGLHLHGLPTVPCA